jgi:hypothetical protein
MIGTNRDLRAMREALEYELFRLQAVKNLPGCVTGAGFIDRQIASLNRERAALCVAIVNRQIEASKDVVVFSRWASGNGALDTIALPCPTRNADFSKAYARQQP